MAYSIEELKTQAKYTIDRVAERSRLRYITPGSGQSQVYKEKGEEATDFIAAGYPNDLSSYPFIQAEVNATGKTRQQVADDIIAAKSVTVAVLAAIEQSRLSGKKNVDDAVDIDDINSAKDATVASLELI